MVKIKVKSYHIFQLTNTGNASGEAGNLINVLVPYCSIHRNLFSKCDSAPAENVLGIGQWLRIISKLKMRYKFDLFNEWNNVIFNTADLGLSIFQSYEQVY